MKKITNIFTSTLFLLLSIATANAQTFEWVKTFGGTNHDVALSGSTDAQGNIYTIGQFQGTVDFDPSINSYSLTANGGLNIFIQKLDASGNFLWAKSFNGSVEATTIDKQGNLYTVGHFQGTVDFDPSVGTYNLTSNGYEDAFIQKLDASGNFLWAKSCGGIAPDYARSVIVDPNNNVYFIGNFMATVDFDPGAGVHNLTANGGYNVFVQKLDASGNFIWAKSFGGGGYATAVSGTIDAQGNIYTVGHFAETVDFDPDTSTYNLTSNGAYRDIFIQKLDASGNFIWAKSFGSPDVEMPSSITIDTQDNIYTTGSFKGTVDFDPGAGIHNLTSNGGDDIFIQKLDASGNFIWAKSFGGTGHNMPNVVTIDTQDNIYTTGSFKGTVDFDPGAGIHNLTSNGLSDVFIQKLDASGNFIWAKSFGGTGYDAPSFITVDTLNNVYTSGTFMGTVDFDPGVGTHTLTTQGYGGDIFIHKLSQCSPNTGTDVKNACNSYTWIDGNTYTTSNNTATCTLTNTAGCDSIVTLNLTINSPNTGTDVKTACNRYVWIDDNTYTTSNNTATHTLTNIGGCDSVVTLNLSINTMPSISIVQNGLALEATTGMNSYQWYLNNTPISGASNATYVATANGSYYCVVVQGACSQNSDTINIHQVSINEIVFDELKIYPNPAKDILYIEVQEKLDAIQLIDLRGKVVKNFNPKAKKLDIAAIAKGVYFIKISNHSKQTIQKLIFY